MNEYSEPEDQIMRFECQVCKGVFWVPWVDGFAGSDEMCMPCNCCHCGREIDYVIFDEEGEED